jgi:CRISPR/Cas system CSM-associated protein Csm2 small subunit
MAEVKQPDLERLLEMCQPKRDRLKEKQLKELEEDLNKPKPQLSDEEIQRQKEYIKKLSKVK